MTKINRLIDPSAPKKPVPTTTPKLRDIPTPPEEKTYKLGKGQDLLLGLRPSFATNNIENWGRSIDQLENGKEGLFSTNRDQYTEATYDANNNEANNVVLGNTGNNINKDTTTRIVLDENDTLQMSGTNTVSSVQSNNDGTVTVTFEEVVKNPNENSQASNQMSQWSSATHRTVVTMPEDSLEKITANLTKNQKKQLGVADRTTLAERLRPETVKADDRYRIPQRNTEDRDRSNTYFNPEDKNKDGKLVLSSKANRAETYNLADNELEGSPNGKDVAQSLEIGELDPDFAGKKKLIINLGEKDSIADIPNSTVEQVSTDLEEGVTTLRLLQKNDNGGSRTITITLPEDSLEKAIENIPKEMQKTILEEAKKSKETSPLETDDSDDQDFRLSNKTLKLPKFENPAKPERTYQLGSNNMKLEPFDFNNAKSLFGS
ncbi:MAG: hypothetical protein ACK5T0_02855 [Vampirovibrionales bacterium]